MRRKERFAGFAKLLLMITIEGKAKHEGIAVAVAAAVNSMTGINGVAPHILEDGIRSVKKGLIREDYPEVVVACDNIAMGISLRIPGINTIGIAAEADMDIPGLEADVPCVIGLPKLLELVSQGDLMVIDGNRGVVYIDPDPGILIDYQRMEDERMSRGKVFIASEHIPARTQTGETVYVYAHIANEGEVDQALDEGADGLMVDLRSADDDIVNYAKALIRAAPGKPIAFVVDFPVRDLLETAARYSAPGQATIMLPLSKFEYLMPDIDPILADIEDDLDQARVNIGVVLSEAEYDPNKFATCHVAIDLRKSPTLKEKKAPELGLRLKHLGCERDAEFVVLMIGNHIDAIEPLVRAGVRSVAVAPGKVEASKYAIRSMGIADAELGRRAATRTRHLPSR